MTPDLSSVTFTDHPTKAAALNKPLSSKSLRLQRVAAPPGQAQARGATCGSEGAHAHKAGLMRRERAGIKARAAEGCLSLLVKEECGWLLSLFGAAALQSGGCGHERAVVRA